MYKRQLKACNRLVGDNSICVTGEIPHEQRPDKNKQIYTDKDVLSGTQSIYSEGLSVDCLSCVILATPNNNEPLLTQLIGRIIRIYDGKPQPTIVDIHFEGKTARRQSNARLGYYMKQSYEVETI